MTLVRNKGGRETLRAAKKIERTYFGHSRRTAVKISYLPSERGSVNAELPGQGNRRGALRTARALARLTLSLPTRKRLWTRVIKDRQDEA